MSSVLPREVPSAPITVVVASAAAGPLAGWLPALTHENGFDLHLPNADPASIASALERSRPQVLVVDRAQIDRLDVQRLRLIYTPSPPVRVLLIVGRDDPDPTDDVLTKQLDGFLLADCPLELFMKAVRAVARGEVWLPRASLGKALRELQRWPGTSESEAAEETAAGSARSGAFTAQETLIVGLVRGALTNKQIARHLDIAEDTVKKHLRRIYTKLGVNRRTVVVAQAGRKAPDDTAAGAARWRSLTPRETQIAGLVRHGCTNKHIARRLGIREDTVKKHLQRIFIKLRLKRRTSVILGRVPGATESACAIRGKS